MEKNNFKNMVVLKSLPSNIVEEAIVIFKDHVAIKSVKEIELSNKSSEEESNINKTIEKNRENDFAIKEAELVLSDYFKKLEQKNENTKTFDKIKKEQIEEKYKKIKLYSSIVTIFFLIENLIFLCK